MRKKKYIIRRWTKNFREEKASSLIEAMKIRNSLKNEDNGFCQIIKVPFRKRHPNFPIWCSIASLLLVVVAPKMDSYICHILQVMQKWI